MEEQLYWIWMSLAFGPANINAHKLLQRYPNPRDLYEAVQRVETPLAPLTRTEYDQIRAVTLEQARAVMEDCVRKHIDVVNMTEQRFPQRLLHIYNPPILLYTLGRYLPFNERLVLTMVGSREVTGVGYEVGRKIAYDLARRDVIVVSGMALGGDSSAHIGALEANGYTAAVIACGCDINYPAANRQLHVQVAMNGCILSEFPPGVRPEPQNFIMRNRILAGVSNGVIVTECRQRSGALSTVNYALEEGRDVFAVPNSALDEAHGGTFGLLQDGAVPVRKAEDILIYYDNVRSVPAPGRNSVRPESRRSAEGTEGKQKQTAVSKRKTAGNSPAAGEPAVNPAGNDTAGASGASSGAPAKTVRTKSADVPPTAAPSETGPTLSKDAPESTPKPVAEANRPSRPAEPEPSNDVFPSPAKAEPPAELGEVGEDAQLLYSLLTNEPQYIEMLITASNLSPAAVLASMTELECMGLCSSLPGQRYLLPSQSPNGKD